MTRAHRRKTVAPETAPSASRTVEQLAIASAAEAGALVPARWPKEARQLAANRASRPVEPTTLRRGAERVKTDGFHVGAESRLKLKNSHRMTSKSCENAQRGQSKRQAPAEAVRACASFQGQPTAPQVGHSPNRTAKPGRLIRRACRVGVDPGGLRRTGWGVIFSSSCQKASGKPNKRGDSAQGRSPGRPRTGSGHS